MTNLVKSGGRECQEFGPKPARAIWINHQRRKTHTVWRFHHLSLLDSMLLTRETETLRYQVPDALLRGRHGM